MPSGHLVFVQSGSLMAVPFESHAARGHGIPVAVIPDVTPPFRLRTMPPSFNRLFDVSPSGTLAFVSSGRRPPPHRAHVGGSRDGKSRSARRVRRHVRAAATVARRPADRRRCARRRPARHLDVRAWGETSGADFTTEGNSEFPLWKANGKWLAYNSDRSKRPLRSTGSALMGAARRRR